MSSGVAVRERVGQMSGNLLILLELLLVFGIAFGWGLNELRQLKKYKTKAPVKQDDKNNADNRGA